MYRLSLLHLPPRLYSSKRLAYFLISISTFFWMTFNLHTLIKLNIQQFGPFYSACYYDLSESYIRFTNNFWTIFNCVFCLSTIVLSVLSFKNVRHIRAVPRKQRQQIRLMTKKDFQLLRCLFVQDVVYISVSIILSLYSIYQTVTRNQIRSSLKQTIDDSLYKIFIFIFSTFFCSGFFVFISVSKAFRHEVKQLIFKMLGKDLIPLREEENQQENVKQNCVELRPAVVSTIAISY